MSYGETSMDSLQIIINLKKKRMRKNKLGLLSLFVLIINLTAKAQNENLVLSKDNVLSIIRTYHPVLKQADLNVKRAGAELLQSRGAFDPKFSADLENKTFNGKEYFNYFNPELSIPTWYGINIKGGTEQLSGSNTDPVMTFGESSYLGVQMNSNQLIFDKRRAALRQAQSLKKLSEAEQQLTINELLFEALAAYWNWVKEYQVYQLIGESVKLNEARLRFVKLEYEQGNRPAIDTTEALAQLQNFYLLYNNAELSYKKSGFELSNYLWLENETPMIWNEQITPTGIEAINVNQLESLESYIASVRSSHPKLKALGFKIDVLDIERKLKFQNLLPDLGVQANLLNKGLGIPNDFSNNFYTNNYKVAMSLNVPLFFRSARGGYQAAKFKLKQSQLEQNYVALEIENKVKSYFNEVNLIAQQIKIYESAYDNNRKLFLGENIRFEIGESTLFVLNSRENKVLEVAQKLQELKTKWHKSYAGLYWALGQLQ
jgi:outer membrane protein TolC